MTHENMKKLMAIMLSLLLFSIFLTTNSYSNTNISNISVEIINFSYNNNNYLAINLSNKKNWHTYWHNPGDAGTPIMFHFVDTSTGKEIPLPLVEWPAPKRFIENGDLWAYGFSNSYTFFFDTKQLTSMKLDIKNHLEITVRWLSCNKICIPGEKVIKGDEIINKNSMKSELKNRLLSLPIKNDTKNNKLIDLTLVKTDSKKSFTLYYNITNLRNKKLTLKKNINLITPYRSDVFDFKHEALFKDKKGNIYGKMQLAWDGEYNDPPLPFPHNGKFSSPQTVKFLFTNPFDQKHYVIEKRFTTFGLNSNELENFISILKPIKLNSSNDTNSDLINNVSLDSEQPLFNLSLLYFILMALLGGLILNIMPCVLPIISLKLFSLIKYRGVSRKELLKHNISYSLGVITTFIVFATIVITVKLLGENLGWGFQLQSPSFVLIMIILLFIFSLNLFGMFEIKAIGGNFAGSNETKNGLMGDFISGVLATILSTPCSAPFLGTALTFAFTTTNLSIFLIFIAIGLGMSSPFLITSIAPSLISFLPKPGKWMDDFKKFLAFGLILTAVWLIDTYIVISNNTITYLNITLTTIFFALYFGKKVKKIKIILYLIPILLIGHMLY